MKPIISAVRMMLPQKTGSFFAAETTDSGRARSSVQVRPSGERIVRLIAPDHILGASLRPMRSFRRWDELVRLFAAHVCEILGRPLARRFARRRLRA